MLILTRANLTLGMRGSRQATARTPKAREECAFLIRHYGAAPVRKRRLLHNNIGSTRNSLELLCLPCFPRFLVHFSPTTFSFFLFDSNPRLTPLLPWRPTQATITNGRTPVGCRPEASLSVWYWRDLVSSRDRPSRSGRQHPRKP